MCLHNISFHSAGNSLNLVQMNGPLSEGLFSPTPMSAVKICMQELTSAVKEYSTLFLIVYRPPTVKVMMKDFLIIL